MELTVGERASGQLSADSLALAVEQVRNNGFVLFERAIPDDLLTAMRNSFDRLFAANVAQNEANRGANRFQMHLPFEAPWSDERVIANTLVLPIVEALVGD